MLETNSYDFVLTESLANYRGWGGGEIFYCKDKSLERLRESNGANIMNWRTRNWAAKRRNFSNKLVWSCSKITNFGYCDKLYPVIQRSKEINIRNISYRRLPHDATIQPIYLTYNNHMVYYFLNILVSHGELWNKCKHWPFMLHQSG